jgi:ABC-2 type transport system ATP-binding protein
MRVDIEDSLAIEVKGLTRSFGAVSALDGVDLEIARGTVFGLLGPNGAGKTTTVRILNGVLEATAVERLRVLGHDLPRDAAAVRPLVGVQTDTSLYDRMSALDNLVLFARLYGATRAAARSRADALLAMFGLTDRASDRAGTFSKGMRQKLLLARALVGDPELVYLDEPTAGLDPEASHELMVHIRTMSGRDHTTFFIASHRLDEMEEVCTQVAVLADGRIREAGSPADVARRAVSRIRVRVTPAPGATLSIEALRDIEGIDAVSAEPDGTVLLDACARVDVPRIVKAVAALPVQLLGVAEQPATLAEAYLALVGGRTAREGDR